MTERNQWATLCATPPPAAAGVAAFDGGRVVVQIAKFDDATVNNPATAVWTDITVEVIEAGWSIGTSDGSESRWPIGQLILETMSLGSYFTHFRYFDPAVRIAPGSLVRLGMLYPGDWRPWFTGIIDRFDTDNRPGPETWRITAYDVLYHATGWRLQDAVTITTPMLAADAIRLILDTIDFPFADALAGSDPFTVGSFSITEPALALLHRVADSYGTRLWAHQSGIVVNVLWSFTGRAATGQLREIETYAPGDVFATWKWSAARERVASWLTLADHIGVKTQQLTNTPLWLRAGDRDDAAGWPKMDLLFDQGFPAADALLNNAVPRFHNEVGIDYIDVDSAHPQNKRHAPAQSFATLRDYTVNDMLHLYPALDRGGSNATGGIGRIECKILGARKHLSRINEFWRLTARYYPKVTTVVPAGIMAATDV